jgi:putative alpha-1,2-mannosidase
LRPKNASRKNKYIRKALLNGRELNIFHFPAAELLNGGTLVLEMDDSPNRERGTNHPNR